MVNRDPTFRERVLQRYGEKCEICGSQLGLEADHIDDDPTDNRIENGMPLCGTCHNLKTNRQILINPTTRKARVNLGIFYIPKGLTSQPPAEVDIGLAQLKGRFTSLLEWQEGRLPFLFQDGSNHAFFAEVHVSARELAEAFDLNAVLKPNEDPRFKYNRVLQTRTKVFTKMKQDARRGRPFADIIVEWNATYAPERPLKVLGGQHRAQAIIDASGQEPNRYHGLKIFFSLSPQQWEEVSRISNTSIPIPKPLFDKQDEQFRHGNVSRSWSQNVGLLGPGEDFADKITGQRRFTVQVLRSLVVNFVRGREKGRLMADRIDDIWPDDVYMRNPGLGPDDEYTRVLGSFPGIWDDSAFAEVGRNLLRLHNKQREACSGGASAGARGGDQRERQAYQDYMYKVMTPQVTAAYAYTSGLLSQDRQRLSRLFAFQEVGLSEGEDPLTARQMSLAQDPYSRGAYRGLGMRQNKKEVRRLIKLFLLLTSKQYGNKITGDMINVAIRREHVLEEQQEVARREQKMRQVQEQVTRQA